MLGLFFKDLYTLKRQGKIMGAILVFYLIFGIVNQSPSFFLVFLMMFAVMLPLTAMGYDEKEHCEKLFLCMPLTRRDLVNSRYLLGLFLNLTAALFDVICVLLFFSKDRVANLLTIAVAFGIFLLYFSICFPIALTIGVEKSRFIMLALIFVPSLLFTYLATSGLLNSMLEFFSTTNRVTLFAILCGLFSILAYLLSWLISLKLYERKEL